MSRKQYLIGALTACEKHEFDKIVKVYLKEIHNYSRVVVTDGKDDIGIDIKVFDLAQQKIQYQVSTQSSETQKKKRQLEDKLFTDVFKAKINYEKYNYSNSLFFFYSKTLTNRSIREYEKKSLFEFGINLTIIEANRIAEESEDFLKLQKVIFETNQLFNATISDRIFPNEEKNLIFDLVGFGKSSEFKLQIVEAFVLQLLYQTGGVSFDEIVKKCRDKFKSRDNEIFYNKLIARLQTLKKISKAKDGIRYILLSDEENRIKNLKAVFELEESSFLSGLSDVLKGYKQELLLEEYVLELKRIYVDNFNTDLLAIVNKRAPSDLGRVSRDFINFIKSNLSEMHDSKQLAISLFEYCKNNIFIQKFCAGKVFSETTNLSKIESYVNTQKRVFIDTQIALYGLCYFYDPRAEYTEYFYKTTKSLLQFCQKNNIELFVTDKYVSEVRTHIREALNLIPFTRLPDFEKLGTSRNVFYNFYLFLKRNNVDNGLTYYDFLRKFGFEVFDKASALTARIEEYLHNIGISCFSVEKVYDIEETKRLISIELLNSKRNKTQVGLQNDAVMIDFLSDYDVDVHSLQPIFLSWDKVLFKVQSQYYKMKPSGQRWFLLTPGKFIDQYSLLQFSINSEMLTGEILALLSDEIIQSTYSLLDSITHILNPNDEIGLEYTNKLAHIRDNEIHRIKENELVRPDDFEGAAVIDDVFYKLTAHYSEQGKMESFRKLFTYKELVDKILGLIVSSIKEFYVLKELNENIYKEFDDLILYINSSKSAP